MGTGKQPFRFAVTRVGPQVIELEYAGFMDESDEAHLRQTEALVAAAHEPVGLCYQVSDLTTFHASQIKKHSEMYARLQAKITGIALVGARTVVRFGATTVGLISQLPLKTFDERAAALEWLTSLRRAARGH